MQNKHVGRRMQIKKEILDMNRFEQLSKRKEWEKNQDSKKENGMPMIS